jgi:hypothetical protein
VNRSNCQSIFIYCHSNRSLAGVRDTELAVAAHQPAHTLATAEAYTPRGAVHCFRMSLWAEHLGAIDPVYLSPWTVECMRKVRKIALENWRAYIEPPPDGNRDIPGHLMLFPYVFSSHRMLLVSFTLVFQRIMVLTSSCFHLFGTGITWMLMEM